MYFIIGWPLVDAILMKVLGKYIMFKDKGSLILAENCI